MKIGFFLLSLLLFAGCATTTASNIAGKNRSQLLIVPAAEVNRMSLDYFAKQNDAARSKHLLVTGGPEFDRVQVIMRRLVPHTAALRKDAVDWPWELVLIDAPEVNAHVMAGGKVTVYTGLIRQLKLNDDEIAVVMGHEMAHALREHTREKISEQQLAGAAVSLGGAALGAGKATMQLAGLAQQLALELPFSRKMESEADVFGLELAARAGYDPQAALGLWDKMSAQGSAGIPQFLSTHPAPKNRKAELAALMPKVMPLYQAANRR
ncbi:MAG: peptidase M48 [Hydrogenophilales bacterium CG03_land_8_20_14_0_80_62_28]|nr:M48 family metallopeptidase [Betaproteobacteria bacterium]OIO76661.1 MAG: peptidase M48 [Hydrogenophilaceae bacterium CG1_02_62_390]PIV23620.1 MAG: peptidase M48 [Hydrogenophilales bacterium CG03_land_8_20_14_0_80_62_28]PIW39405.1 MAG: peptidase M48 [Hydrogenophilales bacterium CG15_BIG_FIL_POST_REV_8_21_14_020_62_31]PIW72385.1 MAG: peptidase M48 [Hydrogenophilales bacterium CG12_big_fil_rev_8_21_14_0_65_61_21]PIX01577.1 MAG: peptidase M48 [Hydrogenophilales bacterium CG_4_8_14_3_um_filter_